MKITQPIRDIAELKKIKRYYREVKPNKRNSLLVVCGLNTALRISDILKLRWKDVYNENLLSFKSHIDVKEQKTGKKTTVFINKNLKEAFASFLKDIIAKCLNPTDRLISGFLTKKNKLFHHLTQFSFLRNYIFKKRSKCFF